MLTDYAVEARLAELREAALRASIERAVAELYREPARRRVHIDPALFARYVWNGLHL